MHKAFFIGPMTKNVVESVIDFNKENHNLFGMIPSRRQVECADLGGGYVNNWNTADFTSFAGSTVILRDHGGPKQGKDVDDGKESLRHDIELGIKFIHIDPWKNVSTIDDAVTQTINLMEFCNRLSEDCFFEIGTESAIYKYTPDELLYFLTNVYNTSGALFSKVVYCVVQSGTQVLGTSNIGKFNFDESKRMCQIVKRFGILAKEHNSDYLTNEEIRLRKDAGVDSLNIAPEFGVLETDVIIDMLKTAPSLLEDFLNLCYKSGKWKKWVKEEPTRLEIARICGHYVLSTEEFINIKRSLNKDDFDFVIKKKIKDNLSRLVEV